MANDNEVKFKITADNTDAKKKLEETAKAAEGMSTKFHASLMGAADASKKFALALAGTGVAVGGFFAFAVKAAAGAETQMARVNAILATMGTKGQEAKAGIDKAAQSMVKLGFDDEATSESIAKLFQKTGDLNKALQLNQLAADLSRAKHIELSQASDIVGKVLSGNQRVLKEYFAEIDEGATPLEQLGQLQEKVAGQAEAFANTFEGQSAALAETWDNFLQEVGTPLLHFLTQVIKGFLEWVDSMGGVSGIITTITTAFAALQPYLPIIIGAIIGGLVPAFYAWASAAIASAAATIAALAPFMIIGAAVAGIAYLIYTAWTQNWFGIQEKVTTVINYLTAKFNEWAPIVQAAVQNVVSVIMFVLTPIIEWYIAYGQALWAAITASWDNIVAAIKGALDAIYYAVKFVFDLISGAVKIALQLIGLDFSGAWQTMKETAKALGGDLLGIMSGVWEMIKNTIVGVLDGITAFFTSWWNTIVGWIDTILSKLGLVSSKAGDAQSSIQSASKATPRATSSSKKKQFGGMVEAPLAGIRGFDSVVTALTPGEVVLNAAQQRNVASNLSGNRGGNIVVEISGNNFYGDDPGLAEKIGNMIIERLSFHTAFPKS